VRSAEEFNEVQRLVAEGMNDCAIARRTGVPRPTVRDWRCRPQFSRRLSAGSTACGVAHDFLALPAAPYAYLLGLYLGDGCISRCRRVWRLRVMLDTKYPTIIDRCRVSIDTLMSGQRANVMQLQKNCVEVSMYSKHWPCLFPQHGPGRKHNRVIALEPWQQALVDHATDEFVIGLIHSDGCRVVANDRGVRSIRYHFSNRSEDIIGLFTAALDKLDIHWTRSTKYIVSIYRKADTARLDTFIGPKSIAVPWRNPDPSAGR
jgi:Homeodomain-like domain